MSHETNDFLIRVQNGSALTDRETAVRGVRAFFYALLAGPHPGEELREVAGLLPEELETLWKPSFYTCLREERGDGDPGPAADFSARLRDRMPDLSGEEARRLSRVVVESLEERLTPEQRSRLNSHLPEGLRAS